MRAIIRRLAQTDLDGGNLDVVGVAALARCTNARLLRDVLPEVDPDEAEAWLRSRTFAEPLRDGVTMHDLVRRAVRADLRRRDPERERELRRRIADHLHARALRGEPRLTVDLAELIENPVVRWGFGVEGSVRYRVDEARDGDAEDIIAMSDKRGYEASEWWTTTEPFFESARDRIVTVRDASEKLERLLHLRDPRQRADDRRRRPAARPVARLRAPRVGRRERDPVARLGRPDRPADGRDRLADHRADEHGRDPALRRGQPALRVPADRPRERDGGRVLGRASAPGTSPSSTSSWTASRPSATSSTTARAASSAPSGR